MMSRVALGALRGVVRTGLRTKSSNASPSQRVPLLLSGKKGKSKLPKVPVCKHSCYYKSSSRDLHSQASIRHDLLRLNSSSVGSITARSLQKAVPARELSPCSPVGLGPRFFSTTPSSAGQTSNWRGSAIKGVGFCLCASGGAFLLSAAALNAKADKKQLESELWLKGLVRAKDETWLDSRLRTWPKLVQESAQGIRRLWRELGEVGQATWLIIGTNVAVFGLWRVPRLQAFTTKYFTLAFSPATTRPLTHLTAMFSHQHPAHLGFNMLALHSFGQVVGVHCGVEQYLALYLSSGLASSLLSQLGSRVIQRGGRSLGASGAIYGCFAALAVFYPEAQIALIFPPIQLGTISTVFPLVVALDAAGVLLRWRVFDHWAHLGGAAFGYLYAHYGLEAIWIPAQKAAAALQYKDS